MIGLPLFSFAIAVDPLLKVLDPLIDFILIDALLTNQEVSTTSLAIVLMHHCIPKRLL